MVSKRLDESSGILAERLSYANTTLCCKEIRVSGIAPIRALHSGPSSKTQDLENFRAASRSRCQQNLSTMELVDDTYDGRRVAAVYYTSSTVTLQLHSTCCGFVVQLVRTVSCAWDFDWHSASRGPFAVAKFLVVICYFDAVKVNYTVSQKNKTPNSCP